MTQPRIAIVWNHPSTLSQCSFRFERYVEGFRALGWEPWIVCSEASAAGSPTSDASSGTECLPVRSVRSPAALENPGYWRDLGVDVVAAVTWHRMSGMLAAARRGGARTISIADSDGRIGLRSHPLATLERSLDVGSIPTKARRFAAWLRRWAIESLRGAPDDREYLASAAESDAIILGNAGAAREFSRFLSSYGRLDLDRRVRIVPFAVAQPFLVTPVPEAKADRVAAVGRWHDPQKDAPLLAGALRRFLARDPCGTKAVVFGTPHPAIERLAREDSRVSFRGPTGATELAPELAACRTVLVSSRREGSPHVGFEALAMGASLVGPALPCLADWCGRQGFGTIAPARRPGSLARALEAELAAWRSGRRDARRIAEQWRPRVAPEAVCSDLLAALEP